VCTKCQNRGGQDDKDPTNLLLATQATGLEDKEQKETEYTAVKESEAGIEEHLMGESLRPKTMGADLSGFVLTYTDTYMDKVFGDHIHHNDGTHLDGGVGDDAIWQQHWGL
jgi:hypothetical protein